MATDLLSINDLSDAEIQSTLDLGAAYRARTDHSTPLAGRSIALLFEKPSLRTKVSFEVAVHELGGNAIYLSRDEVGLDSREPTEDVAHVLERWVAAIVARVNHHASLLRLADAAAVPIVNALSDVEHPCQALADLMTIRQHKGHLDGLKVAHVGDANNCALSLGLGCAATGTQFAVASPAGYVFSDADVAAITARGAAPQLSSDPVEAVSDADVIYTDVWTSMGQEEEIGARQSAFHAFQVNEALLAHAKPGALVMHPMPVHYGEEMPHGMLSHPQSVAYDQAENRLHAQKAVLRLLIAGE